mgnify:CR=1 FL=1
MINLEKFTYKKQVLVPLVDGWGQKNQRKIYIPNVEDGWYWIFLGSSISIEKKASPIDVVKELHNLKKYYVYSLGTEGVVTNFDIFKRIGKNETIRVNFLNLPIFTVATTIRLEDRRFYFYDQCLPKNQSVIQRAKESFESKHDLLELSGATPELRYYFLLICLQRESYTAIQSLEKYVLSHGEYVKRVSLFQSSFPQRLKSAIERAGGKYISHTKRGKGFTAEWEVGGQLVKTNIRDDFSVTSAGYCLSGDDKRHTLSSLVRLAKMFQEDEPLNITRE